MSREQIFFECKIKFAYAVLLEGHRRRVVQGESRVELMKRLHRRSRPLILSIDSV